ncbi:MAG: NifU family protein [Anaerolineae bacterium]|nr:NifU family protein [Anaerolineae bacterium]
MSAGAGRFYCTPVARPFSLASGADRQYGEDSRQPVTEGAKLMPTGQPDTSPVNQDAPPEERLRALIENISAFIEYYHGGSVRLVAYEGDTARVKFGGACEGCPLSMMTLKGWVTGTVHQFFPDLTIEEAVE